MKGYVITYSNGISSRPLKLTRGRDPRLVYSGICTLFESRKAAQGAIALHVDTWRRMISKNVGFTLELDDFKAGSGFQITCAKGEVSE